MVTIMRLARVWHSRVEASRVAREAMSGRSPLSLLVKEADPLAMDITARAAQAGDPASVLTRREWLFEPPGRRTGSTGMSRCDQPRDPCSLRTTNNRSSDSARWTSTAARHNPATRLARGLGRLSHPSILEWRASARGSDAPGPGDHQVATPLDFETEEAKVNALRFCERERPSLQSTCFGWAL
jgi:hypothetical protein